MSSPKPSPRPRRQEHAPGCRFDADETDKRPNESARDEAVGAGPGSMPRVGPHDRFARRSGPSRVLLEIVIVVRNEERLALEPGHLAEPVEVLEVGLAGGSGCEMDQH